MSLRQKSHYWISFNVIKLCFVGLLGACQSGSLVLWSDGAADSKTDGAAEGGGESVVPNECGDGVLQTEERCDVAIPGGQPGSCPTECNSGNACVHGVLKASQPCQAVCDFTPVVVCANGDGCCPEGCHSGIDNDCSASCGNGVLDDNEQCDTAISAGQPGACPTACTSSQSCVTAQLLNGGTCSASCFNEPIVSCASNDGCCPTGCNSTNDNDCSASCGNGVLEQNEKCETGIANGAGSCPKSCNDSNACTSDALLNGGTCSATCQYTAISVCASNDGCCPTGCNKTNDNNCTNGPDTDGDGVEDDLDNCPFVNNPAQATSEICIWPNVVSKANSDPWISQNHEKIQVMRPKFMIINFANGIGSGGNDNINGGPWTLSDIDKFADNFLYALSLSSKYHLESNSSARAFLQPELVKIVNLQDNNGHANSSLFPRGVTISNTPGYRTVGYYQLFSESFAPHYGFKENGKFLTLGEIIDRGLVHEVIFMSNQVDGRVPNPPDQVTAKIMEVAYTAQAYDTAFNPLANEFVKNGIDFHRQKEDMAFATENDANSMPWTGRSVRIYFFNVNTGVPELLHSLGHEFENRYNGVMVYSPGQSYHGQPVIPWMRPLFLKFSDFDMDTRYGVAFRSLYDLYDGVVNTYTYDQCLSGNGPCLTLKYKADINGNFPAGQIDNYVPACGNVHYPPGADFNYDYESPSNRVVLSTCTTFQMPAGGKAYSAKNRDFLKTDPVIGGNAQARFLVYWYQNMPGYGNQATDLNGKPMKNWWPFMFY